MSRKPGEDPSKPSGQSPERRRRELEEQRRRQAAMLSCNLPILSSSPTRRTPAMTIPPTGPRRTDPATSSSPRQTKSFEELMEEYRRQRLAGEQRSSQGLGQPRQRQDPSYELVSLRPSATSTAPSSRPFQATSTLSTPLRRTGAAASSTAPALATPLKSRSSFQDQPSLHLSQQPLRPSQIASPAPSTDDLKLEEEDRRLQEVYDQLTREWEMERKNPLHRAEHFIRGADEDPFAREDPNARGLSVGATRLGQMFADRHRQLVAQQRHERIRTRDKRKDVLREAQEKWAKKHRQAFGWLGLRNRQRQGLSGQELPGLIRSMSMSDLPSISAQFDEAVRSRGASGQASGALRRTQSMSDLRSTDWGRDRTMIDPIDPRMSSGLRRFHPTRLELPETDWEFKRLLPQRVKQDLPRQLIASRLMPSYVEPGYEREIGRRMHRTSQYGIQDKSEKVVKSQMADLGSQARHPVAQFGRGQRRMDLQQRAQFPFAVSSLHRRGPTHRETIPEVSDAAERRGDIDAIFRPAQPSPTRTTPTATKSSWKFKDTWLGRFFKKK